VRDTIGSHRVFQRLDNMFLRDDFIPEQRAPFTVESLGHFILSWNFIAQGAQE
jgi:hypothetical protein